MRPPEQHWPLLLAAVWIGSARSSGGGTLRTQSGEPVSRREAPRALQGDACVNAVRHDPVDEALRRQPIGAEPGPSAIANMTI